MGGPLGPLEILGRPLAANSFFFLTEKDLIPVKMAIVPGILKQATLRIRGNVRETHRAVQIYPQDNITPTSLQQKQDFHKDIKYMYFWNKILYA